MYYKTMRRRLESCGWEPQEKQATDVYQEIWDHRAHTLEESQKYKILLVCAYNKDGTPGKILEAYQGGKLCRV